MGIESLIKAANAAGFAMANSEDLPMNKTVRNDAWRPADPRTLVVKPGSKMVAVSSARGGVFREWWLFLSGKATA
jgi:hypothetical protein